jgi:hypothetical protein
MFKYAVDFNNAIRRGKLEKKIIPHFLSFVKKDVDTWEENKGVNTLDSIGVLVNAGTVRKWYLRTDPDYNFHLKSIRYSVYYDHAGSIEWYENTNVDLSNSETFIGTPLLRFIGVSVSISPQGSYLMGGMNTNPLLSDTTIPIPLHLTQGYEYGFGEVKVPYFISRNGVITLEIANNHTTKDLYLSGVFSGYKVRI